MRAPTELRDGPTRRVLWVLVLTVLALHLTLLLGGLTPLQLRLPAQDAPVPVQLRVLAPPVVPAPRPRPMTATAAARSAAPAPVALPEPEASASLPQAEQVQPAPVQSAPELTQPELTKLSASTSPPGGEASTPSVAAGPEASAWPLVPLGALPPSTLLSYKLTGMDKGLTYHASGELRWQHNDAAYELTLTVRAFLIGSRHWRSVGRIEATGLAPLRFSDSWRNERAAHFDRALQRVVFSSNSQSVPLQPGAQDQVSLYVQLAAAMAGEPERFVPGARLQVQTATVRDAQPWALTLDRQETLVLDGRSIKAYKWVCQARNQYEARVEFWVAAEQAWLPLRILITQASGSYIDLLWQASEPLAPLGPRP